MEALAAMLTADFPQSRWCDQEVGIALGQGKLVIPVKVDIDPYGFLRKHQALRVPRGAPEMTAPAILDVLLKHPSTTVSMTNAVAGAFAGAWNFATAKTLVGVLETLPQLSKEQASVIAQGVEENGQVSDAWGVPERARALLNRHGY